MKTFHITVRSATGCIRYSALARSSSQAALDAAELFGDAPCGISVKALG
jgi:hypothetical protein